MPIKIQSDLPVKEILEKKIYLSWMRGVRSIRISGRSVS